MRKLAIQVAAALSLSIAALAPVSHADSGYIIVVNASNPASALSKSELRKALIGETKQWGNGAVVQVGISSSETPELAFLSGSIGMSASDLLARVQQQVFKGEMRKPAIMTSAAACLGLARSNRGALCAVAAGTALPPEAKRIEAH